MNTDNRSKTTPTAATEPLPCVPDTASRQTAASRARAYLSARLATREGSIGVFRAQGSNFQSSGFGTKTR